MRSVSPLTKLVVPVFCVALLAAGCASGMPDAQPGDIPQIRRQLLTNPGDPLLQTRLGIALYRSEDHAGAEEVLRRVVEEGAPLGSTYLYLGLTNEEQEDWAEARQAYQSYLQVEDEGSAADDIRGRLRLIARNELRQQARQALAQEDQLATVEPAPRSVAVFPFRLLSDNEDLDPLRVAMADMMITDLGLVGGLTVLERAQIQALLNEMALTEAGIAESATGARAGRLLRSEHVVQGVLTTTGESSIRFDTEVLNTEAGASRGQVTEEAELEALFDAEKEVVFGVLDALQVELTAAEREAITENRAENLLAFLEYGRGLQALDRGDYQQAAAFFQSASELDPGFQAAQQQQEEADELNAASGTTTDDVATGATGTGDVSETLGGVDEATTGTGTNTVLGSATPSGDGNPNPGGTTGSTQGTERDPVQESQGQDTGTGTTTATITIKVTRPAGAGGGQ